MPASPKTVRRRGVPASNSGTPRPDPDDLWQLAKGYAICREAENYSPRSIRAVLDAVRYFVKFLEGSRLPTTAPSIGADHIRAYIVYLKRRSAYADHPYTGAQARGLSDSSINNNIRGLSAFWTWLEEEDFVDHNPSTELGSPRSATRSSPPFPRTTSPNCCSTFKILIRT